VVVDVRGALGAVVAVDALAWVETRQPAWIEAGMGIMWMGRSIRTTVTGVLVVAGLATGGDLERGLGDDLVHGVGGAAQDLAGVAVAVTMRGAVSIVVVSTLSAALTEGSGLSMEGRTRGCACSGPRSG